MSHAGGASTSLGRGDSTCKPYKFRCLSLRCDRLDTRGGNYSRNDAKPAGLSEATTLEPWQRGPLCPCRTGGCSRCVPNTFGPLGPPAHCRLSHDNRADFWTKLQWGSHVHKHTWFPPQSYWTRKYIYPLKGMVLMCGRKAVMFIEIGDGPRGMTKA